MNLPELLHLKKHSLLQLKQLYYSSLCPGWQHVLHALQLEAARAMHEAVCTELQFWDHEEFPTEEMHCIDPELRAQQIDQAVQMLEKGLYHHDWDADKMQSAIDLIRFWFPEDGSLPTGKPPTQGGAA